MIFINSMDENKTFKVKFSKIDSFVNRWVSKKLFVFLISTILLVLHYINADQWLWIAVGYIGAQGTHDLLINFKHGPGIAQNLLKQE